MAQMNIFFLFVFILSLVFVINNILKVIKNILSSDPHRITYSTWEKIFNYFFITYLITYIITLTT
jgi:hypothetical protein